MVGEGTGPAIAVILDAVKEGLESAPESYRYDLTLEIEENPGDSE